MVSIPSWIVARIENGMSSALSTLAFQSAGLFTWFVLNGIDAEVAFSLSSYRMTVNSSGWAWDGSLGPGILTAIGVVLSFLRKNHRSTRARGTEVGLLVWVLVGLRIASFWDPVGAWFPYLSLLWSPLASWAIALVTLFARSSACLPALVPAGFG